MRAALIALLLLAAGAAVVAWYGANATGSSRALESPPTFEPRAADRSAGVRLEAPARESASLAGGGAPAPAPTAAIEDRVLPLDQDSDWAKAYAGWSTPRLDARLLELEATFHAEVERQCELRFEAGLYRTVSGQEIAGEDSSYDVLASLDAQGMITRTRAVPLAGLDPTGSLDEEDEAGIEYQVVQLPQDAYVELYRQRHEVEWLRATLAARVGAGEDPP